MGDAVEDLLNDAMGNPFGTGLFDSLFGDISKKLGAHEYGYCRTCKKAVKEWHVDVDGVCSVKCDACKSR